MQLDYCVGDMELFCVILLAVCPALSLSLSLLSGSCSKVYTLYYPFYIQY